MRDLGGSVAKIAGVFAVGMCDSEEDLALVQGLTDLVRHLDDAVLAEWFEDARARELAHSLGIHFAQGFYLACPTTSEALVAWMRDTSGVPTPTSSPPSRAR